MPWTHDYEIVAFDRTDNTEVKEWLLAEGIETRRVTDSMSRVAYEVIMSDEQKAWFILKFPNVIFKIIKVYNAPRRSI